MRPILILFIITLIMLIISCSNDLTDDKPIIPDNNLSTNQEGATEMKLISTAFKEGENIPRKYTCQGESINPPLQWSDAPAGTKSFALIVDDPDAPMGTFIHWLVKDIPSDKTRIEEDSVPGTEVLNSGNRDAYYPPCPPSGSHRYYFKLYALNEEHLDATSKADFYKKAEQHKIAMAQLMGKYMKS